jgi:prepilin-type processing-associated H-X9-DG protein
MAVDGYAIGTRDKVGARQRGALDNISNPLSQITDGTSNTVLIAEDAARREGYITNVAYLDPAQQLYAGTAVLVDDPTTAGQPNSYPGVPATFNTRRFWRWAEQDNGFGVSGDPTPLVGGACLNPVPAGKQTVNNCTTSFQIVNNNNQSPGTDGPVTCNWKLTNNCGSNDEIFSFHTGGANVSFCDGHVAFIQDSINPVVMASLVSRSGGEVIDASAY